MFWRRKAADKKSHELRYWQRRRRKEGSLGNSHYEQFYTTLFGHTSAWYANKRILDIGCGPRGSLEWADMTLERVGLDPLANDYMKLGADKHKMTYVSSPSETIPFEDGHFDVVTSFNSLDHVDDFVRTVAEIARVTKQGGAFLLIVEVNHPPTPTEPITLERPMLLSAFEPQFSPIRSWSCAMLPEKHDIYGSILADRRPPTETEPAVFCVHFSRAAVGS